MKIWYLRFFLLLAAYSLQRFLFIYFNFSALRHIPINHWALALLDGLRFDLCVIATINTPLIAIQYLWGLLISRRSISRLKHKGTTRIVNQSISFLFLIFNVPLILFGIIDSQMFPFTGRRSTLDLFEIMGDVREQAANILLDYWPLTLLSFFVVTILAIATWQKHSHPISFGSKRRVLVTLLAWTIVTSLIIRGGWQTKPLSPAHAYYHQPVALANMVLNSGITILRTPSTESIQRYHDFDDMNSVRRTLQIKPTLNTLADGKNFIIIIVESLATEYMGYFNQGTGYTPFLDKLSKNSVSFKNSFASGRRTIDALPAIFAALPAWIDRPFITSPYATNRIRPLPEELTKIGYNTAFFHAASTGSMHFDVLAKMVGFKKYFGREDYPHKDHDDGHWGIYDEPFLQFSTEEITKISEPFFAGIFTLSSHNPFKIPSHHEGKFPKGPLPIHESIGYADYALEQFFKTASSKSWYGNTIFVITGDHTSLSNNPQYDNEMGRYRVPIIFYDPSGQLPKSVESKPASHIDITPTIFGLLGLKFSSQWLLGGPLFDEHWSGRFIHKDYDTWISLDSDGPLIVKDRVDLNPQTELKGDFQDKRSPQKDEPIPILKASRQYYFNGLLDNSWLDH
jgi:phosphoglycerol transferase MdoB-like AlkP superfamily enzyme